MRKTYMNDIVSVDGDNHIVQRELAACLGRTTGCNLRKISSGRTRLGKQLHLGQRIQHQRPWSQQGPSQNSFRFKFFKFQPTTPQNIVGACVSDSRPTPFHAKLWICGCRIPGVNHGSITHYHSQKKSFCTASSCCTTDRKVLSFALSLKCCCPSLFLQSS